MTDQIRKTVKSLMARAVTTRYAFVEGSYDTGNYMSDDPESYERADVENRYVPAANYEDLDVRVKELEAQVKVLIREKFGIETISLTHETAQVYVSPDGRRRQDVTVELRNSDGEILYKDVFVLEAL